MELISIKRPGFGALGRPINLRANHFPLEVPTKGFFFHYHVEMKMMGRVRETGGGDSMGKVTRSMGSMKMEDRPPLPPLVVMPDKMVSKELRRRVIEILLKAEGDKLFEGTIPAFDGEANLFTVCEVPVEGSTKTVIREILVPKDAEYRNRTVRLVLQECKPKRISWSELEDAIQGRSDTMPCEIISCLNTILREAALSSNKNIPSGRSYFSENERAFSLGKGRIVWVGFYASARPCQLQMSLNLDVSHCVFYEAGSLQQFMGKLLGNSPTAMLQSVTEQQRRQLMFDLRDLKVKTIHGDATRTYTIKRLSRESSQDTKFERNGEKISVAEYFAEQYNIKLKFSGLPMIETANKSYIPVELCTVLSGQKVKRKLTDEQTGTMVKSCAKPAPSRMDHIQSIRDQSADYDNSPHMQQFNIRVAKEMKTLVGRVLPLPKISQRNNVALPVRSDDGTWDTRNSQFVVPMNLTNWAIVVLDTRIDRNMVKDFLQTLMRLGRDRGMTIALPFETPMNTDNPEFTGLVEELGRYFEEEKKQEIQMIMFILGNKSQYPDIKKAGDVKLGVPTQVVLGQTINKNAQRGMPQLAGNLLLKMNVKLGGINNTNLYLKPTDPTCPMLQDFTACRTMVFGADVTHPGFGEDEGGRPSVAAVVASMNDTFTTYTVQVRAQVKQASPTAIRKRSRTQEIIMDLRAMVLDLLEDYWKANDQRLPQQIIFYRDGVSEGQYKEVMTTEVAAIQDACAEALADGGAIPPITYIIVGKRHHIRLFATSPADQAGKAKNVPPGTIADTQIVHFSEFDYYLCSHGGIQGTSRPAHYHVLHDDSKFSADQIQMFSYYLTFLYARCNRSVSIPTPVYYAHLAAFRARHHLHEVDANSDRASVFSPSDAGSGGSSRSLNIAELNKQIKTSSYLKGLYFA